ncbi:MAG: LPS export ABC transporter periplasmic protein LptC [Elusimicrobia bacterium HGW-Elusimicrobia-2]|nr:MAG: LPS export ABC transporter periplasmic protein LptC [Elusimicrobia bacterium HGW-Elusimicrobia-2]
MAGSIRALRLIAACAFLFACGKRESLFSSSESMEGFTARRTRGGQPVWEITGSKLVREDKISVTGASGFFYGDDGKMFLRSDRASFGEDGSALELEGNVCFKDSVGKTELYMDDLKWDEKRQLYVTDNKVRQVSEDAVILGTGLRADKDLNRVEILNPEVVSSARAE